MSRLKNVSIHNVPFNLQDNLWDYIVTDKMKLKSYTQSDLDKDIIDFKKMTEKYDIWDRSFWGLAIHESISAVACTVSSDRGYLIKRLKDLGLW